MCFQHFNTGNQRGPALGFVVVLFGFVKVFTFYVNTLQYSKDDIDPSQVRRPDTHTYFFGNLTYC